MKIKQTRIKFSPIALLALPVILVIATAAVFGAAGPSQSFLKMSWEKMDKAETYKTDCTVTVPFFQKKPGLGKEESKNVDLLEIAFRYFERHEAQSVRLADSMAHSAGEKIDSISPVGLYFSDQLSHEDALQKIQAPERKSYKLAVISDSLYYLIGTGRWKEISDAEIVGSVLESIRSVHLTDPIDKDSLQFKKWKTEKKSKVAIFEGMGTAQHSANLFQKATGSAPQGDLHPSAVTLWVDSNGLWSKAESVFKLDEPDAQLQIKETCKFQYGSKVRFDLPQNAEPVETQEGLEEFSIFMQGF